MALPNSSDDGTIPVAMAPLSATAPASPTDQELDDWNAFYQLLLAGKLSKFGGQFVVIRYGVVVAHGADPEELRKNIAKQLGVAADRLVVPFVDDNECLVVE